MHKPSSKYQKRKIQHSSFIGALISNMKFASNTLLKTEHLNTSVNIILSPKYFKSIHILDLGSWFNILSSFELGTTHF